MLTLKAPLELKCNPAMISSHEAFYHRITGNYGLLSVSVDQEDLLHLVTAPLELYLEEGGTTRIAQNIGIQNSQETKLELINNFLNRITVMEEANLTYQDRVFITDVLKKLGVRDAERFMREVFRLKQETRTTQSLIGLYWNHLEELKDRVEAYHSQERERKTVEEREAEGQTSNPLYQEIMNRLQTGAIYQILNNFQQSHSGNSQYVTRQELQISEQKRVAVQILLQKLRQEVRKETIPLVYRHEDGYRQSEPEEGGSIEAWAGSQISSSVLLNLIDNLYLSLFERQRSRGDQWLSMENALYQAAENTLYRLRTGFYAQWQALSEQNLWNIRSQLLQEQEIHLVQALLRAGWEAEDRFTVLWNRYGEHTWQLLDDVQEKADISYAEAAETMQEETFPAMPEGKKGNQEPSDSARFAKSGEKGEEVGGDFGMESPEPAEESQPPKDKGLSKDREEQLQKAVKEIEEQHLPQEKGLREEDAKAEIQFLPDSPAAPGEVSEEQPAKELIHWVLEGREQFYRMAEQYLRVSEREYRENVWTFGIPGDSLRLEHVTERLASAAPPEGAPGEKDRAEAAETVLLRWQTEEHEPYFEGRSREAPQAGERESIRIKMPGDAAGPEALKEAPEPSPPQGAEDAQSLEIVHWNEERKDTFYLPGETRFQIAEKESSGELVRQIRELNRQNLENLEIYREMQKDMTPGPGKKLYSQRDMRADSLKALRDPEGLLREYEEERQRDAQEGQSQTAKLMELLPEQTRKAYEKLEQHLSAQREGASAIPGTDGSMGLLLRDIRQAEEFHRETEQTREEELRQIQETSQTVLDRWREAASSETEPQRTYRQEQEKSQIALIHKSTQQQIDQEMLDYLEEQNRITRGKTLVTREETTDHQVVNQTVHQQTSQVVNRETEDLTEMIQRGVRQQMGLLSEQIYSRLEKRLRNEKKRRGF